MHYLPFQDLQSRSRNFLLPQETLLPPEFFHHRTHELAFLLLGQNHGPLTIKSQLNLGEKRALILWNRFSHTGTYSNPDSTITSQFLAVYEFIYSIPQYKLASATFSTYTIKTTLDKNISFVYIVFLPGLELPREACIKRINKLYSVYSTHKQTL